MKPLAVLALAWASLSTLHAYDPALTLQAKQPEQREFIPMFNGRDFSGWTNVNCAPETWTMRDGMIVSTGIPTGVLRTMRMYENFVVELEWRHMVAGGNAGFFIYSDPITAVGQPFTRGMEFQIIDRDHPQGIATRHGDVFAIHGATFVPDKPHPQGWMRSLPGEKRVKPQGEWNHYRIESRDGMVTLAVNGKVVSGGSNCVPRKGYICLESEGSECHFRNVRIRELPSSNPPPQHIAEEDQGWVSLYNGLDLRGWREGGQAGHWKARDWILDCDGKGEGTGLLATERSFGNFELIVDWRWSSRTNASAASGSSSGIQLPGSFVSFGRAKPAKPPGQWNRIRITTRGDSYVVRLNDEAMGENKFTGPAKAPIGLQHRGAPMQFANIYVRELK